jgi:uncharacterized protein YidB (DUF937 family)
MDMTGVTNLLRQHGPAIATAAVGLLNSKSGSSSGLAPVVESFTKNTLGQQASSWVGTGENQPVSADHLTPDGKIPNADPIKGLLSQIKLG